jgi:methylmalonyl-CoA/ethylmalonyl-CoA epimerase
VRITKVTQVSVHVKDLDRAVGFYTDMLGLEVAFRAPGMAFFEVGSLTLMLTLPSSPEFDHPSSILYFGVDDLDAAHQALSSGGVPFRTPPTLVHRAADHEVWMAFFLDTEGNTLALTSRKPRTD